MTTLLIEEGITMTDTPIDIPAEWQTPADRAFLAADNAVAEALGAVEAADARLEAARLANAESTPASRSELTKAQRQRRVAGDRLIECEEQLARASKALEVGDDLVAETEVAQIKNRIREATTAAASIVGMYGSLASAASRTSSSQISATHLAALGEYDRALRGLRFQQRASNWPEPSNNRNGGSK